LCCRRTWRRCTRPMPLTSPPYVLLLVVKSGHVGSEWLAELVHKQRFGAFKHEANACVRSQDLVSGLITGAGCSKVSTRDNSSLPLLGLSFNVGAFGESAIATWKAALNATPPTMPIMVVSLTRTNTVKWAWSVYRHQVFDQKSHVRFNDSTPVRRPFEPVHVEPTCIAHYLRAGVEHIGLTRQRAERFAKMLGVPVTHLTYEQLQRDSEGTVRNLFDQAHVPFSAKDHYLPNEAKGTLVKGAPEDLSLAMSNFREVREHPALALPCLQAMFDAKAGEEQAWPCLNQTYIQALDEKRRRGDKSMGDASTCESKDERGAGSAPAEKNEQNPRKQDAWKQAQAQGLGRKKENVVLEKGPQVPGGRKKTKAEEKEAIP